MVRKLKFIEVTNELDIYFQWEDISSQLGILL